MEQLKILITVNGDEVIVEKLKEEKQPEPKPEPQKEPIRLYCVKSFMPGEWVTKGKTYEIRENGRVTYDDGWVSSASGMFGGLEVIPNYLVPLVKRPAKRGEWVLVVDNDNNYLNRYKNGDILKIADVTDDGDVCCVIQRHFNYIYKHEYLVLDGYRGDPEEERKEAERKSEIERLTKEREEHRRKAKEIDEQITKLQKIR